jgi:hypothetical protein
VFDAVAALCAQQRRCRSRSLQQRSFQQLVQESSGEVVQDGGGELLDGVTAGMPRR